MRRDLNIYGLIFQLLTEARWSHDFLGYIELNWRQLMVVGEYTFQLRDRDIPEEESESRRRADGVTSRVRRVPRAAEADARAAEANVAVEDEDDDELAERKAVSELVGWCVSKGAQGSGLSVLLPDGRGRGRGLEASRDIEVRGPVGL